MWFNDTAILSPHPLRSSSISDQQSSDLDQSCSNAPQPQNVFATIWRHQDVKGPLHPPRRANVCPDHVDISCSLTTDPQLEDWHIICLADTESCTASARFQAPETLCERFATSACHGRAWYLRCGQSELPDMAAWLMWQKYERVTVPRQPSWIRIDDDDAGAGLSHKETIICKQSLLTLFETRSTDQIVIVLLSVYFVSNSFRRLSCPELTAAVRSTARSRYGCRTDFGQNALEWSVDDQLLKICSPILESDAEGNVAFLEPSMKKFIPTVQLPGLDHGHGTMTQMCFEQIRRLGTTFIVRPWTRFREWFKSCSDWPLLRYVAKYWWCHYRLAAVSRTDLSAELIRMINMALAGQGPGQTSILLQRRIVNTAYDISQRYDLPELAMILRNLGASGATLPVVIPSLDQWRHMKPLFGMRKPLELCLKHEPTVSDVFDPQSILCVRADSAASITTQLCALHLQPGEDSYDSSAEANDACPPLLGFEKPQLHDWEEIDIRELELQTISNLEDWEFVRYEKTSDYV